MDQDTAYTVSAFSLRLTRFFIWLLLWYALVQRSLPLIAVSAGVLIIAYGTLLWSRFALKNLEADLVPSSTRMFPGDTCTVVLVLKNWKMLPVWVELGINAHAQVQMENSGQLKTSLLPHEERRIVRQLTMEKRGVYPLGSAGLAAGDMLGLNSRSKTYPFPRELIVYPRKREALFPTLQFQEFFGLIVSKELVEDPCWYAGTREYTGTRPSKFIHWKASARLGELQEKIFDSTSHRKILLVLDVRGFADSPDPPGAEEVLENSAALEHKETAAEKRAGALDSTAAEKGAGALDSTAAEKGAEALDSTAAEKTKADNFEECIEAAAALAGVLMDNGSSFSLAVNADLTGAFPPVLSVDRGPEQLGSVLELLARVKPKPVRDLLPITSKPEFRGAGIVYFGYAPPKVNNFTVQKKAPLLYICTQSAGFSGHPFYRCSEVMR